MPKISIAMAVYNGEKYLREQIDSILNQTFADFELVVCDDCSNDGTWETLQEYLSKDSRLKIYKNDRNIGFKRNFERAISLCKGDFIALSDQDDVWESNHIELLYTNLNGKWLACGNSELVDEKGNSLGFTLKEQEALDYIPDNDFDKLKSILLFRNPYQGATMLFTKELVPFILPFPESVNYHDTWIASVACITGGLSYVDEVLLKYRRTKTSITGCRSVRKSKIKTCIRSWLFLDRVGLIDELLKRVNILSDDNKKKLLFYKYLIRNNTKTRKPITAFHLLIDYKNIYSCDNKHWL